MTAPKPLISIIIPVYNGGGTINFGTIGPSFCVFGTSRLWEKGGLWFMLPISPHLLNFRRLGVSRYYQTLIVPWQSQGVTFY